MNRFADARDTGRVSHGEIGPRFQRHFGNDFDLAAEMHEESQVGNIDDFNAVDVSDGIDNLFAVLTGNRADGNVANDVIRTGTDDVYRSYIAAGFSDGCRDSAKASGVRRNLDAQSQAVTSAGCSFHN